MILELGKRTAVLPIHFDVPGHALPLETFIQTSEQITAVIHALNEEISGGKTLFQVLVMPPAEGSFISRLQIWVIAGGAILWAVLESDIGKAFIKGISKNEPAYWSEKLGQKIGEILDTTPDESTQTDDQKQEICNEAAEILTRITIKFMQEDKDSLESIGIFVNLFQSAYISRNNFYEACEKTHNLQGIGFDETAIFPIQREDFARLQVAIPPKENEPEAWFTELSVLTVTSPNWNRDDKRRQWKGHDRSGRDRFFQIDDEYFWLLVRQQKINTHIIDTIEVQWAFQGTHESPRNAKVLRVLRYNEDYLAEPLDDVVLHTMLGAFSHVVHNQMDLFDSP